MHENNSLKTKDKKVLFTIGGISYWDAAIIEAARAADCDTVLSEDLQDGMDFGGVREFNPFQSTESD